MFDVPPPPVPHDEVSINAMPTALLCEPDAYLVEDRLLLGRRAVGSAMLRAAVHERGADPIILYGGHRQAAAKIADAVKAIDPAADTQWIPTERTDLLQRVGTMFRPDPAIAPSARLRLRRGTTSYSLCGITHTLSSIQAQELITGYVNEPLMPWDALICTSTAALGIVRSLLDAALDYHRWRWGDTRPPPLPQFPVIPLGIHSSDFGTTDAGRQAARAALGLAEDEIAILFAGRLSLSTKAHPYPMYRALDIVAKRTGRKLVLIEAGQFFNDAVQASMRGAADSFCPNIRRLHVNGADPARYADAFRGADLFMSLADNVQETFGITPIEAMASGLPVIVTDWNGYRDTVREGIDGFRITSWGPPAGVGADLAARMEAGEIYEVYCARTAGAVSLDMAQLAERLEALVINPDLRKTMGSAGQARARSDYDWSVVYRQYQALWTELGDHRKHAVADSGQALSSNPTPTAHPTHEDPYRIFGHYPTETITLETIIHPVAGADPDRCATLAREQSFQHIQLPMEAALRVLAALDAPLSVGTLAAPLTLDRTALIRLVAQMAKMELLSLHKPMAD